LGQLRRPLLVFPRWVPLPPCRKILSANRSNPQPRLEGGGGYQDLVCSPYPNPWDAEGLSYVVNFWATTKRRPEEEKGLL
jgi:hypothetical protein